MADKTRQPGTVHRQRARIQHDCAECADPITRGQTYIYLNSFDERTRQWSKYLLCSECERIFNCLRVVELDLGETLAFSAGSLRREARAYCQESQAVKAAFKRAWSVQEVATPDKEERPVAGRSQPPE